MRHLFQATKYAEEDLEPLIGYSQMLRIGGRDPGNPPQVRKMAMWVDEIQKAFERGIYQFQDGKGHQVAVVHRSTQENRDKYPWQTSYFWPHPDGIPEAVGHDSCKDLRGVLLSLTENDTVVPSSLLGSSFFESGRFGQALISSPTVLGNAEPKERAYSPKEVIDHLRATGGETYMASDIGEFPQWSLVKIDPTTVDHHRTEDEENIGFENAQHIPIIVYDGMVHDGNHRATWARNNKKRVLAFVPMDQVQSLQDEEWQNLPQSWQAIQSLTIHELQDAEDPEFIHKAEYRKELEPPELDRCYASTVTYLTKSSKFVKNHTIYQQKVLFKDFVYIAKDKSIPFEQAIRYSIEHGDVHVNCQCKSMSFHGFQYIAKGLGYLYGLPNPRSQKPPKIRNPMFKSVYCKHLSRVMEKILQDEELLVKKFADVYNRNDLTKVLPNTEETKEFAPEGPAAAANNPGFEPPQEPKTKRYNPFKAKGSPFRNDRKKDGPYGRFAI